MQQNGLRMSLKSGFRLGLTILVERRYRPAGQTSNKHKVVGNKKHRGCNMRATLRP